MKKGFTLIELLVTVSIIALLAAITLATFATTRSRARIAAGQSGDTNTLNALGDRLIAQWTFDNNGAPFADSSGSNHSASCTTCPTATTSYDGSTAYYFNNSYLTAGIGSDYLPLPTFTFCSWEKTGGLGSGTVNGIFSLSPGMDVEIDANGLFMTRLDDGTNIVILRAPGSLYDNNWHNLCVSFDGTKRNMYVDGGLRITDSVGWQGTTRWPTWPSGVTIGVDVNDLVNYKFNGDLDNLRLYSGAVTQAQAKQIYLAGLPFHRLATK